jgi:phospholipid/cholesterol/gamma-HCH transport system substrate-binding protein
MVGLFVLVATGLLIFTLFYLTGLFDHGQPVYRTYLTNAGGLAPGSDVRYAGGPPIGHVAEVHSDPNDVTRLEVIFRVHSDIPVKTDSRVKIASIGALGDNYLGIIPGTQAAPRAPSGSELIAKPYSGFDELSDKISAMAPQASALLQNLNARVIELQVTIARVNDLIGDQNRANVAASLANLNGMLAEDRPQVRSTLGHLDESTAKLPALLDDFKKTVAQANDAISHLDAVIGENRPDIRQAVIQLRATLTSAASATDQLDRTLTSNDENIDELLDNIRHVTENLRAFTDEIKSHPTVLIRAPSARPHIPGEQPKP